MKPVSNEGGTYWANCQNDKAFGTSMITYRPLDGGGYAWSQPENCVTVDRVFKLVDFAGGGATLLDTYVPTGAAINQVHMGTDRLFLARQPTSRAMDGGASVYETKIDLLTGIRAGKFQEASTLTVPGYATLTSAGTRMAFAPSWSNPNLVVYETVDPASPTKILETSDLYSSHGIYSMTLDPLYAILAIGKYGVGAIRLP